MAQRHGESLNKKWVKSVVIDTMSTSNAFLENIKLEMK